MICTFYSYKGGVGRSMALANAAEILSRQGLRILMIDFDLEAPGLEQFFFREQEREQRDAVRGQKGLLDLLLAFKDEMSVAGGGDNFRDLDKYIFSILGRRPGGGRLDLLPAGQRLTAEQLAHYARSLRSFDWQDFYFEWEGDLFFEWLRRSLVPERYDVVLIDSRTGVTEMGGICGYQLADVIVMMCGANHQNVDGTWSMLEDFRSHSGAALRRGRSLEVVVVPARVEQHSAELLEAFYERFNHRFGGLVPRRLMELGVSLRDLAVPYDPLFAFEERVARGQEEQAARQQLSKVFGALANAIIVLAPGDTVNDAVSRVAVEAARRLGGEAASGGRSNAGTNPVTPAASPRDASSLRPGPAQARYDETRRFADFDVMLDAAHEDFDVVERLRERLSREGLRIHTSSTRSAPGDDWNRIAHEALSQSRALAVAIGSSALAAHRRRLVESGLQARAAGRELRVVVIRLPSAGTASQSARGASVKEALDDDPLLRGLPTFDLQDERKTGELGAFLAGEVQRGREPKVDLEERCPYPGTGPYTERHADLFFGRDEETRMVLGAVEQHAVTVLVGPSACGKTSLVLAGLLPALRRAHPDWRIQVASSDSGPAVSPKTPGVETLVTFDDMRTLSFEPSEAPGATGRSDVLSGRMQEVARAGARILVCLRSEQHRPWQALVRGSSLEGAFRLDLRPPEGSSLRRLVERPADAAGLAFEPGLVDRIVNRAEGEPGALPFLQTTLQRLWEGRRDGWLTNAAYDSFGGIRGVVGDAANRQYEALAQPGKAEMRRILLRLVKSTADSTRASVLRARYDLLAEGGTHSSASEGSAPPGSPKTLLGNLVDARVLVTGLEDGEPTIELAHETLARDWPRMQVWLEQERGFLAWQAGLAAELQAWKTSGRHPDRLLRGAALAEAKTMRADHQLTSEEDEYIDESGRAAERSQRRKKAALASAVTVLILISLFAGTGWFLKSVESTRLEQSQELLEVQLERDRKSAQTERDEANSRISELQGTLERALAAARSAASPSALPPAAVGELERAVSQAGKAAEYQDAYSAARANELNKRESAIRGILAR